MTTKPVSSSFDTTESEIRPFLRAIEAKRIVRSRYLALAAAASLALALGACGGSPTAAQVPGAGTNSKAEAAIAKAQKAYSEVAALAGPERTSFLKKKAEEEGSLTLYTSNVSMDSIVKLFSKKYKIKVDTYLGTSESVLQRVIQENSANYFGSDVIEGNGSALYILNTKQLFADYKSEARSALPEVAQSQGWTASRFAIFVTAWDTKLVKQGEEPKSFEDLADPRWKGKLAMEISDTDWYYTLKQYFMAKGKTEAEVKQLFEGIAANSVVTKGHTSEAQFLAAGQFSVCVACYTDAIDRSAAAGAPVTWKNSSGEPIQPLVNRTSGTALMKTAQHPYAAVLFSDFMLSPEVQKTLTDDHRIGSVVTGANDPLKGYETLAMNDAQVLKFNAATQKEYADILRKATPAK